MLSFYYILLSHSVVKILSFGLFFDFLVREPISIIQHVKK
ncbi:hypothetical protein LEP1GSC070_3627 [Leptospira santarosai str. AIM]|uniref:Uncharacterized protein n=1 Tax=Leptospira santarosai serovar Arenal str. MAVJ 401 TaxID=1049976 RepID=M6JSZ7_9LEPT|nr:hypothetical protein LEP1GSC063_1884 [Leptospira santarosai serovar Arenal str. MAVJ 401]EMO85070.1 hypothetical protein LEP1GSC070_3627 [Leptospira santarosai str. AIM]EPG81517.1 hypothetical protein LEP1GSC048_2002 [Leptospira santarosai serovar Shermani str. 1342KT]